MPYHLDAKTKRDALSDLVRESFPLFLNCLVRVHNLLGLAALFDLQLHILVNSCTLFFRDYWNDFPFFVRLFEILPLRRHLSPVLI